MSGPVCFRATINSGATTKPSKEPHHRKTDSRCTLHLHGQRHATVWLRWICAHYCWWKTPAPTPELFCWALQAGQPCTPPCIEGGRAGEARMELLSFDGMGGGVQAHNQNTLTMISYSWGESRAQPCWTTDILTQCCLATEPVAQSRHSAHKHRLRYDFTCCTV